MWANLPPQFDSAISESQRALRNPRKLRGILQRAARKAEHNYGTLLAPWETLQTFLRLLRADMTGRFHTSEGTLALVGAALLYFLNPFDLIPDAVPVFGFLDDAAVIASVAKASLREISAFRNWEAAQAREDSQPSAAAREGL